MLNKIVLALGVTVFAVACNKASNESSLQTKSGEYLIAECTHVGTGPDTDGRTSLYLVAKVGANGNVSTIEALGGDYSPSFKLKLDHSRTNQSKLIRYIGGEGQIDLGERKAAIEGIGLDQEEAKVYVTFYSANTEHVDSEMFENCKIQNLSLLPVAQ